MKIQKDDSSEDKVNVTEVTEKIEGSLHQSHWCKETIHIKKSNP